MKAISSSTSMIFSSSTPPYHSFTPLPTMSSPASKNTTSSSNLRNVLSTRLLSNTSASSFLKDPSPWILPRFLVSPNGLSQRRLKNSNPSLASATSTVASSRTIPKLHTLSLLSQRKTSPTFGPHPRNLPFAPSSTPLPSPRSLPSLIPPFLFTSSQMLVTLLSVPFLNNPTFSTDGTLLLSSPNPCNLPNSTMTSTTKNSLLSFTPSKLSAITSKVILNPLKYGPITITSPTSEQSRNSPAVKLNGHSSSLSIIFPSSTNPVPSIRPMLCPGVQTIKRGCFLRTTKPEPSLTASSLPSTLHKPNPMTLYCVNKSRMPSPTIPKSA